MTTSTSNSAPRCARWPRTRSPRTPPRSTGPASSPRMPTRRWSGRAAGGPHPRAVRRRGGRCDRAPRIVIEEVARACASSSLIPAVNKLGTMPLDARGAPRTLKKQRTCRRSRAARRCSPTRCPSPRRARDAAAMRTRAVRDGDGWVLNGAKRWITNAGVSSTTR